MKLKKIVVLDKNDFSDKQKEQLKALADEVEIYDDMPKDDGDVIQRIGNADAVIVCWHSLNRECIDRCENLKYLGVVATGYGWLSAEYAVKKGKTVTNVPGYATNAVADFIFRQLDKFDWKNKTLGIIGLGRIGARVAEIAKEKGLQVIYWNRTQKQTGFQSKEFDEIFKESDIVVLQVTGCKETEGIVKNKNLDDLKNGTIIINVVSPKLFEDEKHLIGIIKKKNLKLILDFEEKSGLTEIAKKINN
jgi:phosphoglycerate dehydrogenase-like enzyme